MTVGHPDALAGIAELLSAVDRSRRLLGSGSAPLAEVYLEAARGNIHHAREALLRYERTTSISKYAAGNAGRLEIGEGKALCRWYWPDGWVDENRPARPDLGADLMISEQARLMSLSWHAGGMLLAALADHAWLHMQSGASWSSDRSGASALIAAMNGGRPVAHYDVRTLSGTLDIETVNVIASIGWRRLRSPEWAGGEDQSAPSLRPHLRESRPVSVDERKNLGFDTAVLDTESASRADDQSPAGQAGGSDSVIEHRLRAARRGVRGRADVANRNEEGILQNRVGRARRDDGTSPT